MLLVQRIPFVEGVFASFRDLERVVDEVVEVLHAVSAAEVHAVVDHATVALRVWQSGRRVRSQRLEARGEMMRG